MEIEYISSPSRERVRVRGNMEFILRFFAALRMTGKLVDGRGE